MEKSRNKNETKKKSFFAKVFEKLDRKMQDKAKSQNSCCGPSNKGNNSCCS